MTLSADDIRALIADFQSSGWEEMALTSGDISIVISRSGGSQFVPTTPGQTVSAQTSPPAVSRAPSNPISTSAPSPETNAGAGLPPSADVVQAHGHRIGKEVTSPTVGLFWRSSQNGGPPFVEVGQRVTADDTVGIIEVMKLMNHVKAGIKGTVLSIETDNGAMVESGTVLMFVEPDV